MGKTLEKDVSNSGIKRSKKRILAGVGTGLAIAVLGLGGCKQAINQEIIYPVPDVNLSASSVSFKKGESTLLTLKSKDGDKKGDITNYELAEDKDGDKEFDNGEVFVSQSSPIVNYDFAPASTGIYTIMGRGIGKGGIGKTSLDLVVSSSDVPIEEPIIEEPVVEEPVEPIKPDEPKPIDPIIPALPTVDFSGVNANVVEGRTSKIELPEGVDYTNVRRISGEIGEPTVAKNLSTNKYELTLKANTTTQNSQYKLEFDIENKNGTSKATLEAVVENLCDIEGRLESTEEPGVLKEGTIILPDGTSVPTSGTFNVQVSSPASIVKIKAYDNNGSYVRTVTLDGTKDYGGLIVRPFPSPGDINNDGTVNRKDYEDFIEFMRRLNFGVVRGSLEEGLKKGNLVTDLEILDYNPITNTPITSTQQVVMGQFLNQIGLNIQKDNSTSEKHYTRNGGILTPDMGWGIIVPVPRGFESLGGASGLTTTYDSNRDGYIDRFIVMIDEDYLTNKSLLVHEVRGHGKYFPGHASEEAPGLPRVPKIYGLNSAMEWNCPYEEFQKEDLQGERLVKDDTYKGLEKEEDILGMRN